MRKIDPFRYGRLQIDEINRCSCLAPLELISRSEQYYHRQIAELAQRIAGSLDQYRFLLLAGPSASGKTTTAHKISERLTYMGIRSTVVSLDDFYRGVEFYPKLPDGSPDFESIHSLDIPFLQQCMSTLLEQGSCLFPRYDFIEGKRRSVDHRVELDCHSVLIIEGIHALNPLLTGEIPRIFRVYVSARDKFMAGDEEVLSPKDVRLIRRMVRDNNFRNYSPERTLQKWDQVLQGEQTYINPFRDAVDFKLTSTMEYEPCVFTQYLRPILKKNPAGEYSQVIDRLYAALDRFEVIDKSFIPDNSLLREFIGN